MAKTVSLDWNHFMSGEVKVKRRGKVSPKLQSITKFGIPVYIVSSFPPNAILAATTSIAGTDEKGQAWAEIFSTIIEIADWLCVGVIMFAGAIWMFGNRSKALEMLIGACSGYLVIRHAPDLQRWLANI
jgi:hypothetical protein